MRLGEQETRMMRIGCYVFRATALNFNSLLKVEPQNENKTTLLGCVIFPQGCSAILEQAHRGLFYLELGFCEKGRKGQMC